MKTKPTVLQSIGRAAAAGWLGLASFAFAQPASSSSSPSAPGTAPGGEAVKLEEFIVTGGKSIKSLQETFASVGYVGARDIEESQIRDFADAFRMMANVRIAASVDSGFIIRGINSQGIGVGSGALGTMYIDGVAQTQQSSRRGANGMWDTASIEVFRGPHSTLSGRNSLAGAIFVRTKDPTFTPESALRMQVTDNQGYLAAFAHSAPISESFAFRIAGYYSRADDWFIDYPAWVNRPEYKAISTEESYQLRGKLLYQPKGPDGLRVLAHASHSYYRVPRGTARGTGGNAALAAQYGVKSVFDRVDYANSFLADFNNEARDGISFNAGVEATVPVAIESGDLTLTSVTTFIDPVVHKPSINGAFMQDGDETEKEFSQEFRANYASHNGRFEGVLGIFALKGDETNFNDQPVVSGSNITARRRIDSVMRTKSGAIFGEGTLGIGGGLKLVAGGRINYEKNETWGQTQTWNYTGAAADFRLDRLTGAPNSVSTSINEFDGNVFLPKVGLIYDLTPKQSLSFTFQRGYRDGGTGTNTTVNPPQRYYYSPEFTENYEIAWRSSWLDDRLTLNANVFYTEWLDQQIPFREVPTAPISLIVNAGESYLQGFEVETRFRARKDLSFFANAGYTHSEFIQFVTPSNINFKGARFPDAPFLNWSAGFDYTHESGWFVRADSQYTGKTYSLNLTVPQNDAVAAGDYLVHNLNIGFRWKNWRFTAFARNLTDEDIILLNGPLNDDVVTFGRPRMLGISVDAHF